MASAWCAKLSYRMFRKKNMEGDIMETPLRRCLTTADLTFLGLGQMIGAGIFVLTGTVMKDIAGPGVILCYLFAGIAAFLSSLCYAEFGARIPKTGSAYVYSYVTVGEFCAFLIGWNIILENMIGASSVARAFSATLDSLFNGAIKNATIAHIGTFPSGNGFLGDYPDFLAVLSVLVACVFVAFGAKMSANINAFFTLINVVVIVIIIVVGWHYGTTKNYASLPGHFLPYGFGGVIAGTASCFYAYIGFESIAIAGEEAEKPESSIPKATAISMVIATVLYIAASSALIELVPYTDVDPAAPFPMAFASHGLKWMKYTIAVGALFGITSTLVGGMFALPRTVYAMSADGLFFQVFATIHPRLQTPLAATVVFGFLSSLTALFFSIEILVEFLSIGTLLSFTMVAVAVLIVRYQTADMCQFPLQEDPDNDTASVASESDKRKIIQSSQSHSDIGKLYKSFSNFPLLKNIEDGKVPRIAIALYVVSTIVFAAMLLPGWRYVEQARWWSIVILVISGLGIVLAFSLMLIHQRNKSFLTFQMPLVPYIPALSIFLNICLMMMLKPMTWLRLVIWLVIGLFIYFLYGIHHSHENRSLSSYDHMINYSGDSGSTGVPATLEETLHPQQPVSEVRRISYRRQSTETEQEDPGK